MKLLVIKEEMEVLAETGDIDYLTESERQLFEIILEKFSEEQLEELGLKKI